MLRKLLGLVAAVGMLSAVATTASAGIFLPLSSTLTVNLGALPTVTTVGAYQYGGWATLSNNGAGHDLSDTASIWVTTSNSVGTSLLTGVSLLDRLTLTAVNKSGAFTASFSAPNPMGGNLTSPSSTPSSGTLCPGGCLGGNEGFSGVFVLGLGALNLPFNLETTGGGGVGIGGTASLPLGTAAILATNAPFITGKARITGITTNVLQVARGTGVTTGVGVTLAPAGTETVRTFTTNNGFRSTMATAPLSTQGTVTLGGTNILASASAAGQVTLISPQRINTGALAVGNIPGVWKKTFVFVPEPGTVLLLVSGAAGLIFIGRKRMKG